MPRKKICFLSESSGDWGGASRVLFTNLQMLDQNKFDYMVLIPSEGPIIEKLDEWGIRYEFWGFLHEPAGWLAYIRDVFKAMRCFRRNKIDLLHINHVFWRPAEVLAAKLLRIPLVTHLHWTPDEIGPFLRLSDVIIANSNYTAQTVRVDNTPTRVIYPIVHLARYDQAKDIKTELGFCKDDIIVSFIGQIKSIKGIELFIKLANTIINAQVKFLICGNCEKPNPDGQSYTEERLKSEIAMNNRIKYLGYRADIENIYQSSDIILVPSRWEEPFGLINIEAGAARKPVIATRVGGIPEIIRHGENGFLIEKNDLAGLTTYTNQLIADADLRLKMGCCGRINVERKFTDAPIRELEALYAELLS